MKSVLFFLLCSATSLFGGPPWPGVAYIEVRAYAWDPAVEVGQGFPIRPDLSLAPGVVNQEGTLLSAGQVKGLLAAEARRYDGRPLPGCYNPHNAFVFYDAAKKPVAFLEVCFDCVGSRIVPADNESGPDFEALAQIFAELKLPFGQHKSAKELKMEYVPTTKSPKAPAGVAQPLIPGLEPLPNPR